MVRERGGSHARARARVKKKPGASTRQRSVHPDVFDASVIPCAPQRVPRYPFAEDTARLTNVADSSTELLICIDIGEGESPHVVVVVVLVVIVLVIAVLLTPGGIIAVPFESTTELVDSEDGDDVTIGASASSTIICRTVSPSEASEQSEILRGTVTGLSSMTTTIFSPLSLLGGESDDELPSFSLLLTRNFTFPPFPVPSSPSGLKL